MKGERNPNEDEEDACAGRVGGGGARLGRPAGFSNEGVAIEVEREDDGRERARKSRQKRAEIDVTKFGDRRRSHGLSAISDRCAAARPLGRRRCKPESTLNTHALFFTPLPSSVDGELLSGHNDDTYALCLARPGHNCMFSSQLLLHGMRVIRFLRSPYTTF